MKYLLFLMLLTFSTSVVQGQEDSLSQELETVVISDKRIQLEYSQESRNIIIIDQQEISNSPAQSLAELLQNVAGIDVRRRGVNGIQADLSIRGGTFDQSLVLINGVNMSDPQTGHHIMNLPVDLDMIERVEILKGPGARRYGQNAFAGAINIVTKKTLDHPFKIRSSFSSNTTGELQFMANIPTDKGSHMLSVSKGFSEGYRYNTDYQLDNVFYQSTFDINGNTLSLNAGYSDRRFGANGFYASPDFTEQYEEVATSIVSLRYGIQSGDWNINPTIYWRRNEDEYIFVRNNPSIYRNLHIGNSYGGELNASWINALGVLGIGSEIRYDDLRSNNLGDRSRTTLGLNLEQRILLLGDRVDVTPGVGLYSYSDFGMRAFPGLDVGIKLNNEVKAYGNVGYTWRVPTYTDLFYSDPANLGNPDLEPETAVTYEVGLKWIKPGVQAGISGFIRNSDNLIDWTKENQDDPWFPSNVGNVVVKGLEVESKINLTQKSKGPFINVGYVYLTGDNRIDAPVSRYALDLITHQFNLGLDYSIVDNISITINYRYVDRLTLDNYSIVDTRFNYRGNSIELSLFANNLLNKEYTETNLVPMPGRWIGIELGYNIR
ncbi:MAG: TonB-dependent receptor [Saprospiraceae bacterium]|nr:TonB-dependent receptor [Saprospiraceae bacterium]